MPETMSPREEVEDGIDLLVGGVEPRKTFALRRSNRLRVNDGALCCVLEASLRNREPLRNGLATGLNVGEGRSSNFNQIQCRVDRTVVLQVGDRLDFKNLNRASQAALDPIALRQKIRPHPNKISVGELHVHRDACACGGRNAKCSLFPLALTVTLADPALEKRRGYCGKDCGNSSHRLNPHSDAGICNCCENARGTVHCDGAGRQDPGTAARSQQIIASRHNVDTAQLAPRCQSLGRMQNR